MVGEMEDNCGAKTTLSVEVVVAPALVLMTRESAPVLALAGTMNPSELLLHQETFAATPPIVTLPADEPKLAPDTETL